MKEATYYRKSYLSVQLYVSKVIRIILTIILTRNYSGMSGFNPMIICFNTKSNISATKL